MLHESSVLSQIGVTPQQLSTLHRGLKQNVKHDPDFQSLPNKTEIKKFLTGMKADGGDTLVAIDKTDNVFILQTDRGYKTVTKIDTSGEIEDTWNEKSLGRSLSKFTNIKKYFGAHSASSFKEKYQSSWDTPGGQRMEEMDVIIQKHI